MSQLVRLEGTQTAQTAHRANVHCRVILGRGHVLRVNEHLSSCGHFDLGPFDWESPLTRQGSI